ncbi:MAG: hypothetical protein QOG82_2348 [Actinomycetota bacterium]|jgi:outer membrane protein assembly factor BamB|nr:hypothetical protein [Actinomycetota bacterium]
MQFVHRWANRLTPVLLAAALPLVVVASGPAQAAVAEPQFAPYRSYPVPAAVQSLAIGDFTGDGRADVVANTMWAAEPGGAKLFVYAQMPAGELELRATLAVSSPTSWAQAPLAAGDLNDDGRPDVVVPTGTGLDVFLQGDAGLGDRTMVTMPGPAQVEIGDVDADGHSDVVANGTGGVSWLRGAGDGTLGPPIVIAPARQVEIAVGDLTGDGRLDVIGFADFDPDMHLFRQQADGTFAAIPFDAPGHGGLAIGDVTGDGRSDIVDTIDAAGPAAGIFVLPQRADHSLGPAAVYDSSDNPGPVEIGDLNGDGRLDVVTLHDGYPEQWAGVHTQDTDGTLTADKRFPVAIAPYTREALDVGDVTGDGRPDVVWVEQTGIVVLRALAPLPPTTTSTTSSTTPGSTTSTSTTSTTSTTVPPPVGPGESTSYQVDAAHSGRLAGGAAPPLEKHWTRDLGGTVSYPLVAEGMVFALAATAHAPTLGSTLFALDAATGEDVWGPLDLGSDAWFAYGDGQVFVLNKDGVRRSLDAATGTLRWIDREVAGTSFDAPPVYEDGALWYHAIGNFGGLVKISADDGHQMARLQVQMGGDSIPAVANGLVYSSYGCSPTRAFDAETGAAAWTYGQWCAGTASNFTPVVAEGMVWARSIANRPPTAIDAVTGAMVVNFATNAAPTFDGGRGYFLAHGVLEARDPRTQAPLWSFAGDGQLALAPIVVHGYVYVASASGQLWALDGETGAVAWTGSAGAPVLPTSDIDNLPQIIGLAAGQGVIAVPASNLLVAFGAEGATVAGHPPVAPAHPRAITAAAVLSPTPPLSDEAATLGIDASHQSRLGSGRETAPLTKRWTVDLGFAVQYALLAEGKVFVVAGPKLLALDALTGLDAWPPVDLGPGYSWSPIAYGDGRVFGAARGGPLRAFDAATGAELWSSAMEPNEVLSTPPVYSAGLVYTVSHHGGLRAVSAGTGSVAWRTCGGGSGPQPPSVADGTVYAITGLINPVAFDALSGANPWGPSSWATSGSCGGGGGLGASVAGGRIWTEGTGFRNTPLIFDLDGRLVGAFGGTQPAFDDTQYYVIQGTALKAKDQANQHTAWTFLGDGGLTTPPVVIDGLVYVGSTSGRVWALDPSTGTPVWEDDAGAPIVGRGSMASPGTRIAAGQGLVVVPASNTLVAFEPVTPPPPPPVAKPLAWGWNAFGQLGDGSTVDRRAPVPIANLTDVIQVAAGAYHDLALRADGTVWASGWNDLGLLGDGTTAPRTTPVQVVGLTDVVAVSAGSFHSVALKRDGTVWAWGWNGMGQIGDGTTIQRPTPVKVAMLTDVVQVSAGLVHTLALKKDGTVWSWGWNGAGQLGDGGTVEEHTPVRARGLTDAISVGAGSYHSLAVKRDGTVVSWGWNTFAQLGDGTTVDHRTPQPVAGLAHVAGVAGGYYHSLAVHDDGTVSAWGWNGFGAVGDGTTTDRLRPVSVPGLRGITAVSAGFYNSLARREDGRALGWGWNGLGQLGDGTLTTRTRPQPVPALFDVESMSAGALHSVVA